MRITFVLPSYRRAPIGGYKVVYEYANRLQAMGHRVAVVHPRDWTPKRTWREQAEVGLWKLRNRLLDGSSIPWFPLHPEVELLFTPDLRERHLPDADCLIATAWQTADWVAAAGPAKGRKFYLVQGYEVWNGQEEEVSATWRLPLHKIVIAGWLLRLAEQFGEAGRTSYIPNGMDLSRFRMLTPLSARDRGRVGMLYSSDVWKGTRDGVEAMERVRSRFPDVRLVCFGREAAPADLPDWIEYVERPSPEELVRLYNSCAIFVQPSWTEGWGLAATESMACGCALVTTANGGAGDYALDGRTALVTPIREPRALAERMIELLGDDALRERIASAGHAYVQRFTWERAAEAFEAVLRDPEGSLGGGRAVPVGSALAEPGGA